MILVSGTKRSGTSMWMQVLAAGRVPILGDAFPRGWDRTIREANPDGFFESILREGIYYRTNPHPSTGDYFLPEHVDGFAVKVFVPGVIRTERAYIGHLIANVRSWREYEASIERLYAMERTAMAEKGSPRPSSEHFPPAYEWWMENFSLVRDISLRRYPARLMTYEQVLAEPERVVRETLEWIGAGDVDAAIAAVKPERRTQRETGSPEPTTIDPSLARVFDDLYAAVAAGKGFSKALLSSLNAMNQRLLPQLIDLQRRVLAGRSNVGGKRKVEAIDGLPQGR